MSASAAALGEIKYDNGAPSASAYGYNFNNGLGVRFTTPTPLAELTGAGFYFSPDEEGSQRTFSLRVEDKLHNTLIETPVTYTVHNVDLSPFPAAIVYVDLSSYRIAVSEDFYIFAINHKCLKVDTSPVGSWRNYYYDGFGNYFQYEKYGTDSYYYGNVMIRAYVATPPSEAKITHVVVVPDSSGVDQGSKMTFTINVQNTGANDMSSTRVQLKIYKPGGRVASSPSKTITRFIAGSTRTIQITYNLPKSAATGDWTYGVYVYRSSTLLDSETDGGFKVRVPSGIIVSVADSPDPVLHGGTATFTVTIKNTGNLVWANAKITIKILKPDGKLAKTLTINARNIQPGIEYTYTKDWRIPTRISTSAPIGTYSYNVYLTYGSTAIANSLGNTITIN